MVRRACARDEAAAIVACRITGPVSWICFELTRSSRRDVAGNGSAVWRKRGRLSDVTSAGDGRRAIKMFDTESAID